MENPYFYQLLFHSLPQVLVSAGVNSVDLKDLSEAAVDESLESFHGYGGRSQCFRSVEYHRLYNDVIINLISVDELLRL